MPYILHYHDDDTHDKPDTLAYAIADRVSDPCADRGSIAVADVRAKRRAVAAPMPRAAPVMRATLSASLIG